MRITKCALRVDARARTRTLENPNVDKCFCFFLRNSTADEVRIFNNAIIDDREKQSLPIYSANDRIAI